jgi:CRP-like cAMP-binding protein
MSEAPAPATAPANTWVDFRRLRRFELFATLRDPELAEIARHGRELSVPAGATIIRQGQVGEEVYLLEDGLIKVYRERRDDIQMLALIDSPAVFGEMAIVTPERIRTASVKALTELRLIVIPVKVMLVFLRRFPLLRHQLQEILARRVFHRFARSLRRDSESAARAGSLLLPSEEWLRVRELPVNIRRIAPRAISRCLQPRVLGGEVLQRRFHDLSFEFHVERGPFAQNLGTAHGIHLPQSVQVHHHDRQAQGLCQVDLAEREVTVPGVLAEQHDHLSRFRHALPDLHLEHVGRHAIGNRQQIMRLEEVECLAGGGFPRHHAGARPAVAFAVKDDVRFLAVAHIDPERVL